MTPQRGIGLAIGLWLVAQPCARAADVSFSPASGGSRFSASIESLLERRWKHVIRQQLDLSCGSAALATILRYQFGDKVNEPALIRAIIKQVTPEEIRKRGGFSMLDLKRVASELGYHVEGYKLSVDQLEQLHGPALVPIQLRSFKHFIVLRGVVGDRVVLADPAFGNLVMERSRFASIWKGVALVITKDTLEHIPARLSVSDEDLSVADAPDALRALNTRAAANAVKHDEF